MDNNSLQHIKEQAVYRGYQARLNDKPITDNYYLHLGKKARLYCGYWESGWIKANQDIKNTSG